MSEPFRCRRAECVCVADVGDNASTTSAAGKRLRDEPDEELANDDVMDGGDDFDDAEGERAVQEDQERLRGADSPLAELLVGGQPKKGARSRSVL